MKDLHERDNTTGERSYPRWERYAYSTRRDPVVSVELGERDLQEGTPFEPVLTLAAHLNRRSDGPEIRRGMNRVFSLTNKTAREQGATASVTPSAADMGQEGA